MAKARQRMNPHDPKLFFEARLMISQSRPLIEVFADLPDFRKPQGKRHPLSAMLSLSCGVCGVALDGVVNVTGLRGHDLLVYGEQPSSF
jgi:hypothetical protein